MDSYEMYNVISSSTVKPIGEKIFTGIYRIMYSYEVTESTAWRPVQKRRKKKWQMCNGLEVRK